MLFYKSLQLTFIHWRSPYHTNVVLHITAAHFHPLALTLSHKCCSTSHCSSLSSTGAHPITQMLFNKSLQLTFIHWRSPYHTNVVLQVTAAHFHPLALTLSHKCLLFPLHHITFFWLHCLSYIPFTFPANKTCGRH